MLVFSSECRAASERSGEFGFGVACVLFVLVALKLQS